MKTAKHSNELTIQRKDFEKIMSYWRDNLRLPYVGNIDNEKAVLEFTKGNEKEHKELLDYHKYKKLLSRGYKMHEGYKIERQIKDDVEVITITSTSPRKESNIKEILKEIEKEGMVNIYNFIKG